MMSVANIQVELWIGSIRTAINNAYIHAERFTREVCNIRHIVAVVAERHYPVKDGGPDTHPCGKSRVDGRIVHLDDVVDGVVEQRDQSGDSDNSKWLTR